MDCSPNSDTSRSVGTDASPKDGHKLSQPVLQVGQPCQQMTSVVNFDNANNLLDREEDTKSRSSVLPPLPIYVTSTGKS